MPTMTTLPKLGELMNARGIATKELAEKSGVGAGTINRIKRLPHKKVELETAKAILAALDGATVTDIADEPLPSQAPEPADIVGRSVLYPPVIPDAQALRMYARTDGIVTPAECAGCYLTLQRLKVDDLPPTRAACKLRHGYVAIGGAIVHHDEAERIMADRATRDTPVEEPVVDATTEDEQQNERTRADANLKRARTPHKEVRKATGPEPKPKRVKRGR